MNFSFAPSCSEQDRRHGLYRGDLVVFPPSPSTIALADFARGLVEEAFSPLDPRHAHERMAVQEAVQILTRLKPHFIHHATTKVLLQRVLLDHGCFPTRPTRMCPACALPFPRTS